MPLNHPLVGLFFTATVLLFLSIQVVCIPSSALNDLIAICTFLLLRCLLSDRYNFLFIQEIMLFLLILRMLICIFLLLGIIIAFYHLFGATNLTSGRLCLFGWLQPLGFSQLSLNQCCSFCHYKVCLFLFTWTVSWSLLQVCWQEIPNFVVCTFILS